jgi:non-canonical purine NTP pyrophosphatase (RdgB/HAM1 family)
VRTTPAFVLVTGNRHKWREAERILGHAIANIALDLPEIQSADLMVVLEAKAETAWQRLRRPLVVEETGLELAALNGFPGPLVRFMLEAVGAEGIAGTAVALGRSEAVARCALLYRDAERSVRGVGASSGRLVLPARGDGGFGWDPVFVPEGEEGTYAELGEAAKDRIGHRGRAWRDLVQALAPA